MSDSQRELNPAMDAQPHAAPYAAPYAEWALSPERQSHEWKLKRRALVATRMRLVVYGHLLFFFGCLFVDLLGKPGLAREAMHCGWVSLLITSLALMAVEWIHVRFPPQQPPRFVVRSTGVTEYGDDGARYHLDFLRTRNLRLECDKERPEFRSLVFVRGGLRWLHPLQRCSVPLPEKLSLKGALDEQQALKAVGCALAENGFDWTSAAMDRNHIQLCSRVG